jgi:hypothetical protein
MANPYRDLFKAPGSRAFILAGMIARMAIAAGAAVLGSAIQSSRHSKRSPQVL